jgi:hypothetical protein
MRQSISATVPPLDNQPKFAENKKGWFLANEKTLASLTGAITTFRVNL